MAENESYLDRGYNYYTYICKYYFLGKFKYEFEGNYSVQAPTSQAGWTSHF